MDPLQTAVQSTLQQWKEQGWKVRTSRVKPLRRSARRNKGLPVLTAVSSAPLEQSENRFIQLQQTPQTEDVTMDDSPTTPDRSPVAQWPQSPCPSSPPQLPPAPERVATPVARAHSITCPHLGTAKCGNIPEPGIPSSAEAIASNSKPPPPTGLAPRVANRRHILETLGNLIDQHLNSVYNQDPEFVAVTAQATAECMKIVINRWTSGVRFTADSHVQPAPAVLPVQPALADLPVQSTPADHVQPPDTCPAPSATCETCPVPPAPLNTRPSHYNRVQTKLHNVGPDNFRPLHPLPDSPNHHDPRLFVRTPPGSAAASANCWAIREQIGTHAKALVREVQSVRSGFALVPKGPAEAIQLHSMAATISKSLQCQVEPATKWFNYLIPHTPTVLLSFSGIREQVSITHLTLEAQSITGLKPTRVAWSRHGDPDLPHCDVVVSFEQAVPAFRLFSSSAKSRPLRAKPRFIQCKNCHGFHHERACRNAPRCPQCSEPGHSTGCSAPPQCSSCRGPHDSRYLNCPLRPKVVGQQIQFPTRREPRNCGNKN